MPEDRSDADVLSRFEFEDAWFEKGFTSVPNVIINHPRLSGMAKMTYIALLSFAWGPMQAHPGQARLARMIGSTDRSLRKYVDELEIEKLVQVTRRGLGLTDVYKFLRPGAEIIAEAQRNGRNGSRSGQEDSSEPETKRVPRKKPQGKNSQQEARQGGEQTMDEARSVWAQVLDRLKQDMNRSNYEDYLLQAEAVSFEGDEMVLVVANPYIRDTLEQRFSQSILRALYDVVGRQCRLRFT